MSLSIGVFTYSSKPRGSVVCAANLAEALHALGHETTLYALDKDGAGFFRPVTCQLCLVPAGAAPPQMDRLIRQRIAELAEHLERRAIEHDIYHAQDCLVTNALHRAQRLRPIVRTVHHLERFESPYLEQCQARSLWTANALVSVSRATRHALRERFGLASEQIESGVTSTRFLPCSAADRRRFLQSVGVPAEAEVLLSIGGIEPRKNSLCTLDAFARYARQHPRAHWLVAGGASIFDHAGYRQAFLERLDKLPASVKDRVKLLGVLSESALNLAFSCAELLLHAALHEGWGLVTLEAMASGTAVVVSQGAPFDEYLDASCACFVDPNCADSIHAGIEDAHRRRTQLSAAARARSSLFNWQDSAHRHLELYQTLLDHSPTPLDPSHHSPAHA